LGKPSFLGKKKSKQIETLIHVMKTWGYSSKWIFEHLHLFLNLPLTKTNFNQCQILL
jgi:hypothetical protein